MKFPDRYWSCHGSKPLHKHRWRWSAFLCALRRSFQPAANRAGPDVPSTVPYCAECGIRHDGPHPAGAANQTSEGAKP